tara:strand:+ start:98 stop:637 length:540 start_codon:yes stop_codon:yes gene_type:complete
MAKKVDEFIDKSGGIIHGDKNNSKAGRSSIRSKETTDQKKRRTSQGPLPYGSGYFGYGYSYFEEDEELLPEKVKTEKKKSKRKKKELKKISEDKMRTMMEDILARNGRYLDVQDKSEDIANIETVDNGNPMVSRRVNNMVDMINNLDNNEKVIVLVHLLNGCDLGGCPHKHKNMIRKMF